jgi:hypothetical protein
MYSTIITFIAMSVPIGIRGAPKRGAFGQVRLV